eukprot:gene21820-19235_t
MTPALARAFSKGALEPTTCGSAAAAQRRSRHLLHELPDRLGL